MGPIESSTRFCPFCPDKAGQEGDERATGAIPAAPYGSPSILPISIRTAMMGEAGLRQATEFAILNATYMAALLGITSTFSTRVPMVELPMSSSLTVDTSKTRLVSQWTTLQNASWTMGFMPLPCRFPLRVP